MKSGSGVVISGLCDNGDVVMMLQARGTQWSDGNRANSGLLDKVSPCSARLCSIEVAAGAAILTFVCPREQCF